MVQPKVVDKKSNKKVQRGIGAIHLDMYDQLFDNVFQLIANTMAYLSALELGQKLQPFRIYGS